MNEHPSVAIITRTYERPLLLRRAVDSVLKQSYDNWHHVVINDGGDPTAIDNFLGNVEGYNGRLSIIHALPKCATMEEASNRAIASSKSDLIVIHDDDDTWHPEFLAKAIDRLREARHLDPSIRGVITGCHVVSEKISMQNIETIERQIHNEFLSEISLLKLAKRNQFPPISFLFDRAAAVSIGGFNASFPVLGDWDFNVRFLANFSVAILDEPLANYHIRNDLHSAQSPYANTLLQRHAEMRPRMRDGWIRAGGAIGQLALVAEIESHLSLLKMELRTVKRNQRRLLRAVILACIVALSLCVGFLVLSVFGRL